MNFGDQVCIPVLYNRSVDVIVGSTVASTAFLVLICIIRWLYKKRAQKRELQQRVFAPRPFPSDMNSSQSTADTLPISATHRRDATSIPAGTIRTTNRRPRSVRHYFSSQIPRPVPVNSHTQLPSFHVPMRGIYPPPSLMPVPVAETAIRPSRLPSNRRRARRPMESTTLKPGASPPPYQSVPLKRAVI